MPRKVTVPDQAKEFVCPVCGSGCEFGRTACDDCGEMLVRLEDLGDYSEASGFDPKVYLAIREVSVYAALVIIIIFWVAELRQFSVRNALNSSPHSSLQDRQ